MSYYTDISDMPLYNWRKCQEKQTLEYCRIGSNKLTVLKNRRKWVDFVISLIRKPFFNDEKLIYTDKTDAEAWIIIYDSFLLEFGLGEDYERMIEIRRDIAIHECDLVITNNRFIQNLIVVLKKELGGLMNRPIKGDTDTILANLSKWQGHQINEREITVKRFYKMIEELKAIGRKEKLNNHGKEK